MADRIQEVEETTVQNGVPAQTTRKVTTATSEPLAAQPAPVVRTRTGTAERVIYYIVSVLIALLAFRFVLSLLGANRDNGFANFIYSVTYPFAAPFFGLFGYKVNYGVSRFEIETLVAMLVYGLIAYGLVKLLHIGRREA